MPVQHLRDSRLPSAFLAAGKKQMALHNSYLLHLVIPSAFRAARKMQVVSFAFSPFRQENQLASFSNIFAFCYCHKMQLGTLDCGTRSFAFLAAGKKQMAIYNGYRLHLVIPSACRAARKMQVVSCAFCPFRQENQLASFSNIFAFCYCHKMQLGTLDCGTRSFAFLVAGKKQMALHNSYLLHLVIPSAFRAARKMQVVSFAFSPLRGETHLASFSNIFAFCYCHKMQLGNADCGTQSFAFLAAGKKELAIHNGYLLHLVIPSAFRAARKMQVVSFAFSPFRQENQLASFSNIFAFCYCHKMQLGTLDCGTPFAFLVAGKKQMALHNGYLLHLVIPSAFRAARKMQVVSCAFSPFRQETQLASFSNIFAFCYCHKMQLGNADCGTQSFAFLAAGKKHMAIHNGYLLHLVIPSACRAARKMQVVSCAFSPFRQETQLVSFSNIFAFCYCHKMQLGNADCGTRSFAFLAIICDCVWFSPIQDSRSSKETGL